MRQVVKAAKRLETVDTCVLEARFPAGCAAQGAAPSGYVLMAQRPKAGLLGGAPRRRLHALRCHTVLWCAIQDDWDMCSLRWQL